MILCMTSLKNNYLSKLTYPADLLHGSKIADIRKIYQCIHIRAVLCSSDSTAFNMRATNHRNRKPQIDHVTIIQIRRRIAMRRCDAATSLRLNEQMRSLVPDATRQLINIYSVRFRFIIPRDVSATIVPRIRKMDLGHNVR